MDLNNLFTEHGMRAFTASQRDQHLEDARQYGQLADVVEQRLKATPIDGDRFFAETLRTRKVVGKLRRMEKASRKAAGAAESLYATYVHQVLELPQRRDTAAARKAARRARRGKQLQGAVAGSLGKSAAQMSGLDGQAQADIVGGVDDSLYLPAQPAAAAPAEVPAPAIGGIADFFPAPKRGVG